MTFTNSDGTTVTYSGTANDSGSVTVTVKRKGTFEVTSNIDNSNNILSVSPASASTLVCSTNGESKSINYVRVSNCSNIYVGTYSNYVAYCCWDLSESTHYSGVMARYRTGSAPSAITDGINIGSGKGSTISINSSTSKSGYTVSLNSEGTTYYFGIWPYITVNNINYYGNVLTASWYCHTVASSTSFSSSGSWTVPTGVRSLTVFCVGGGGAGGGGYSKTTEYTDWNGGGGGGGGYCNRSSWGVVPGEVVYVSVGAGGSAVTKQQDGNSGGSTSAYIDSSRSVTASGGGGGYAASDSAYTSRTGGAGGAGGGGGVVNYNKTASNKQYAPGNGGSNGGNGSNSEWTTSGGAGLGGSGQGASVVSFNGTYYSGGGAGGGCYYGSGNVLYRAYGGNYGGGYGAWCLSDYSTYYNGEAGTAGSGGGGGGGYVWTSAPNSGAGGSGTVIINYS